VKAVFDTNILIDYLKGISEAKVELQRYDTKLISLITWMEVLVGSRSEEERRAVRAFLNSFAILEIDQQVAETAVILRQRYGQKLPDALIYATAKVQKCQLVTRNTKDFISEPDIRVPYTLAN
jgi:predicted nucleic acid-binding protein